MKTLPRLLLVLFAAADLCAHAAPGDLDLSFGTGGKVITPIGSGDDRCYGMAVQSDGKIVLAGDSHNGSTYTFALVRYMASGALDTSFGTGGKVTTPISSGNNDSGHSVAVQSDGKIVLAGTSVSDFALVRYTADGALDTSFGTGGKVTTPVGNTIDFGQSVAVQSDGKIVVAGEAYNGSTSDFALVRYTDSGALDMGFGTGGKVTTPIGSATDSGRSVAVQSDGKIILAGDSFSGSNYDIALVRYTDSGALDTSFGTGGKVTTPIGSGDDIGHCVALQSDGKIVVAGYSSNGSNNDFALVRYTDSGALDTSFGTGGKVTTDFGGFGDIGVSVAVQSDGKIVVAGNGTLTGTLGFALVRYTAGGELDMGFGTGGKVITRIGSGSAFGRSVAVQSDGKVVVAGMSGTNPNGDFAVARYQGGSPGDSDSDGLLDTWELTYWPTIPEHKALDDFDGDGVPELLEEAFGLNPTLSDAASLPQAANEGGYLTMTITKHAGVIYEVQSAGTLLDGQPDSFRPATTTILLDDATTLKVRDNVPFGTPPARYLRVKVTAAP